MIVGHNDLCSQAHRTRGLICTELLYTFTSTIDFETVSSLVIFFPRVFESKHVVYLIRVFHLSNDAVGSNDYEENSISIRDGHTRTLFWTRNILCQWYAYIHLMYLYTVICFDLFMVIHYIARLSPEE